MLYILIQERMACSHQNYDIKFAEVTPSLKGTFAIENLLHHC